MSKWWKWYIKAQVGVLMFPAGLCLFGEAISRRIDGEPWFWIGTASLTVINAGIGLMIDSGLLQGIPKKEENNS